MIHDIAVNTKGQELTVGAVVVYKTPQRGWKQRNQWHKRQIIRFDHEADKVMAVFRVSYGKHGVKEERRNALYCYLPRK